MKSLTLLMILIVCNISVAFAVTGTPNEIFRPLSKDHVEKVLARGIKKIGKLDLKKLSKELDKVEWRTFDLGFLAGSGGVRTTSIYLVEKKMVVINILALNNLVGKPVHINSLALHEAMGALGYEDENYDLSSAISFLATTHLENLVTLSYVKNIFSNFTISKENRLYAAKSGGSTVVGGGGDAVIIELKQRLLKRYFEWISENNKNYSSDQIRTGFEALTRQKIEFNLEENDYGQTDFSFNGKVILMGLGGQIYPELIFQNEYLDRVLLVLLENYFEVL